LAFFNLINIFRLQAYTVYIQQILAWSILTPLKKLTTSQLSKFDLQRTPSTRPQAYSCQKKTFIFFIAERDLSQFIFKKKNVKSTIFKSTLNRQYSFLENVVDIVIKNAQTM